MRAKEKGVANVLSPAVCEVMSVCVRISYTSHDTNATTTIFDMMLLLLRQPNVLTFRSGARARVEGFFQAWSHVR